MCCLSTWLFILFPWPVCGTLAERLWLKVVGSRTDVLGLSWMFGRSCQETIGGWGNWQYPPILRHTNLWCVLSLETSFVLQSKKGETVGAHTVYCRIICFHVSCSVLQKVLGSCSFFLTWLNDSWARLQRKLPVAKETADPSLLLAKSRCRHPICGACRGEGGS